MALSSPCTFDAYSLLITYCRPLASGLRDPLSSIAWVNRDLFCRLSNILNNGNAMLSWAGTSSIHSILIVCFTSEKKWSIRTSVSSFFFLFLKESELVESDHLVKWKWIGSSWSEFSLNRRVCTSDFFFTHYRRIFMNSCNASTLLLRFFQCPSPKRGIGI